MHWKYAPQSVFSGSLLTRSSVTETHQKSYGYPGFPDPGFLDPGFPDPGFPDLGFLDPGFPDPGFPDPDLEIELESELESKLVFPKQQYRITNHTGNQEQEHIYGNQEQEHSRTERRSSTEQQHSSFILAETARLSATKSGIEVVLRIGPSSFSLTPTHYH